MFVAVMLLAIVIIPASAAMPEEIDPNVVGQCLYCGSTNMTVIGKSGWYSGQTYYYRNCTHGYSGKDCSHLLCKDYQYRCYSCAITYWESRVETKRVTYCPEYNGTCNYPHS